MRSRSVLAVVKLVVLAVLASSVAPVANAGGQITNIGVTIDRYLVDGATFEDCFCTDLEGSEILSVTVKSPANANPPFAVYSMVFVPDEDQWAYDEIGSPALIAGKFPDGVYEFTVTYFDMKQDILGVTLVRDFPPFPVLTGFSADSVHWAPWAAGPSAEGIEVVVWGDDDTFAFCDDLPVGETSCTLPPGFVQPDSSYVIDILFLVSAATASNSNSGVRRTCQSVDPDGDGVFEDGDCSGVAGDNVCTAGAADECDDNCFEAANPD
ncbi:MAG: hypothetical protein GY716_07205 [bacterium]|nr:hypothetical protein [bacterium]